MNNNKKFFSIAIVVVLIVGFGLFLTREEKPKEEAVAIRMLDSSSTVNSWEIVKKLTGRDILEEEGVKLELISNLPSLGGSQNIQALLANNIDRGSGATLIWVNAIAAGGKIRAVVGSARTTKERPWGYWSVLEDSNISSVEDFKDKKIAVGGLGTYMDTYTIGFLKEKGLSKSQVQIVVVPSDQQEQMLRSKQVDIAVLSERYFVAAKKRGGIKAIVSDYDLLKKETVITFQGFREDFITKHPDTIRRYVTAFEKSERLVWEEFQKDPERVRKAASEIIKEKEGNPGAQIYYPGWSPSSPFIKDEDVQIYIDWFVDDGILKPRQLKPSDVYTNEFNSYYKK